MARSITITKVQNTTIVEVIENANNLSEVFSFNKSLNLELRNNTITISDGTCVKLSFTYAEITNKLASTDAKDYLSKAATAKLFCSEAA